MGRHRQQGKIVLGVMVAAGYLVSVNLSMIEDVFDLPPRPTSAAVEQLALATAMTRPAQRLFYRQNPTIEPHENVVSDCKVSDKGIMLGCYSHRGKIGKIVIQSVTDPRLRGVMEVTAAHEMLHAAYEKLSPSERDELTPHLEKAIKYVKDQRLLKVLQDYQKTDTAVYVNELHSYLGTELDNLADPFLEKHYRQYFSDRSQVIVFADRSGAPMRKLDQRADGLKPEIETLEADLKREKQALNNLKAKLNDSDRILTALKSDLDQTRATLENASAQGQNNVDLINKFEDQKAKFNHQVGLHNELVGTENNQIAQFNQKIDVYKQKISDYNQVGKDQRLLLDSLTVGTTQPDPPSNSPFVGAIH
jgi:hypothetical protein